MNVFPDLSGAPSAWRGEELFERGDFEREFSAEEIADLDAALADLPDEADVEALDKSAFPFPKLGLKLSQIQLDLEAGSGATRLRGLPIERYSETQARQIFWGLANHLGTPVSQSADGERIFSVRDEGFQVGQPQARGPNTRKRLSFHTDRCDVIAFLCLKQAASGGENQLVSSIAVYNEIARRDPELLGVLMQPFYYRRHNVDTGNDRPWCQQPIFSFCEGHFACSYLRVLIDRAYEMPELPDMTDKQSAALALFEEVAADPELHVTFRLQPGDVLLVNNWITLHRRNEFVDHDDPQQRRHLLRIWLAMPNSRPLDPLFADNYGATTAGALRGGMRAAK